MAEAVTVSMPVGVTASTQLSRWEPRDKDLKRYFHFDRSVGKALAIRIANDPDMVAKHKFYPLIRFYETWKKFRHKGKPKKTKVRPLRYAAHLDALIFARYRHQLSSLYESELTRRKLSDVPVAYRRIVDSSGKAKCNIEIARDVFAFIRQLGDCIVTVVDIKSYFESLDHSIILSQWSNLLGQPLGHDHMAVYKAVTKYSVVDYDKMSARLALADRNPLGTDRRSRRQRKIDALRAQGNRQVCTPEEFRQLIAGGDPTKPSLIQKNGFDFGIPQGTPISDLIANFYLIDFDEKVNNWVTSKGGMYRRYSDDLIVALPTASLPSSYEAKIFLQHQISQHGPRLSIQDRKVCICSFSRNIGGLDFTPVFGVSSRNGLEYLGFEFDGRRVKIKNSTLSNAWRKMKRQAYGHAFSYVRRYRDKGEAWIRNNYPRVKLEKTILQDVTYNQDTGYDTWTFVKYARRASRAFVGFNPIFSEQTRRYRYFTKVMIEDAIDEAIRKVRPLP